ncbi:MAG: DapH/DapD/GlmU-related protein [Acidimicrobiia bacterium]|nr:DapH/DapD/GlmU-related protein [Acidimicrobiia bacterium]
MFGRTNSHMGKLKELFADEPSWLARAQIVTRSAIMLARGVLTFSSCTIVPRPVLRGRHVQLLNRQQIDIGAWSVIEDLALIQGRSEHGVRIGERVSIGRGAQIRPTGLYGRRAVGGLSVGNDSNIGIGAYIGCSDLVEIGERVLMGPGVRIFSEWHNTSDASATSVKEQGVGSKPVRIEDGAWIASGVTILPGVTVGKGAVVAAGAVVNEDVPHGAIVGGIPAKVIRSAADRLEEG